MLFNIQTVQKRLFQNAGKSLLFAVERELIAEVIGETKICVTVHPYDFEEEWPLRDESSSSGHGHHHHGHKEEPKKSHGPGKESSSFHR